MSAAHADLQAEPLFRGAVDLLRAHPLPLLLPFALLGAIAGGGGGGRMFRVDMDDPLRLLPFYAFLGILGLVVLVLVLLAYGFVWLVTTHAAMEGLEGRRPDPGESMGAVWSRFSSQVGTYLLVALVVFVGFALLVVPGLVALSGLLPWAATLRAEGKEGVENLRRTWDLTRGHKTSLFLLLAVSFLALLLGSLVLEVIPGIGGALSGAWGGVVVAFLAVVGALFHHRRIRETPTPPVAAAPAVLDGAP